MNELYYGDNLDVLRRKVASGSVDLCYIDPPFNSKLNCFQIYNNQVKKITDLSDLKALRFELGHRKSKRAAELDDLVSRVIREWTGSYDPNAC